MKKYAIAALAFGLLAAGCYAPTQSANDIQREQQQAQDADNVSAVGTPNVPNARDLRQVRWMYEARDRAGLLTYTYALNLEGRWVWICDSIGYPISLGTQYSPPTAMQRYLVPGSDGIPREWGVADLPLREPNGTFPPSSGSGTMVACINPQTGIAEPQHVEDNVNAFTYPRPDAIGEPSRTGQRRQVADPIMAVGAPSGE